MLLGLSFCEALVGMSNFAHCPTPDNEEEEVQEINGVEGAYTDFKGEEEEYSSRTNINVSSTSVSEDTANSDISFRDHDDITIL